MTGLIISKENIAEEVYLTNHEDFVKVNGIYYGGLQKWLYTEKFRLKFWADRSCGVTAAANSIVHIAMHRPGLQSLYHYPSLSKSDFTSFMNYIYTYLKPTIIGIASLRKMEKGLQSFLKFKGIRLESKSLKMQRNIDDTIKFIQDGLRINSPIMMLTWNSKIKDLKYHWVTITGYIKTIDGKSYIITSNWGAKEIFSLDELINDRTFYRGLIYFTI